MRTLDILPLANDAPLADIDFGKLSTEVAQALNILAVATILAIALTGMLDLATSRWLLIGGAPSLSSILVWPMFRRRGLERMRVGREPAGLWAFLAANVLALGIMLTIGETLNDGREWPYLLQLILIPALVDWMARDALAKGWLPQDER